MSASRNLGIKNSNGEYVGFLDSDDIWLPKKLEQQVRILNSLPNADLVYEATLFWYSWEGKTQNDLRQDLGISAHTLIMPPKLLTIFLRNEDAAPSTCSFLVRRIALDQNGGFEESFPGMYEDQVFLSKMCLQAPVFAADGCLSRHRMHADSYCSVAIRNGQYHPARMRFLTWLADYLHERGIEDREVWSALEAQLWAYRHSNIRSAFARTSHLLGRHLPRSSKALLTLLLIKLRVPTSMTVPDGDTGTTVLA